MIAKNKRKIIVSLIFLLFISFSIYFKNKQDYYLKNQLIFPNVFVDNIDVGGKSQGQFLKIFEKNNQKIKSIKLEIINKNEKIATFSGKILNLEIDSQTAYLQSFLIGRSPHFFAKIQQRINSIFSFKKYYFFTKVKYNNQLINEFVELVQEKYNQPARNALFNFKNGKVIAFKKEEYGKMVDLDDFYQNLNQFLEEEKNSPKDKTIILKIKTIVPEITLAKANNFGIEEIIGEGNSNFSYSSAERIHNIILASFKFNGILIAKNKILSFNETIGDISIHTGYKQAYIIKDGKTVLGDGGGICQVSTTLFRAALNTGLPIIERHPHAYRVHYYENDSKPGFDATVFAPTVDFKVKNDTPAYILIETIVDKVNQTLTFRLYGKKDERKINISPVIIWDIVPPPDPLYQEDPLLKKGEIKQTDFAAWGAKTKFHYQVTFKNNILFERDFISFYKPWRAVYLVGVGQ